MVATKVHFRPNWGSAVVETYQFLTEISVWDDGSEERAAMRDTPRRTVKFATLMDAYEQRAFTAFLYNRTQVDAYLPNVEVPDMARNVALTTQTCVAGTVTIPLSQMPTWMANGLSLALTERGRTTFVVVASFTSGTVTLTSGLAHDVGAGAEVRPSVVGAFEFKNDLAHLTDGVAENSVTIKVEPGTVPLNFSGAALPVFESRPVLTTLPNWQGSVSVTFEIDGDTVDYDFGSVVNFRQHDILSRTSQFTYMGRVSEDIGAVANLFLAMRGRQGEFWCPSMTQDMIPLSGITSGSSNLVVEGRQIADIYGDSTINKALAIRLSNGTWVFRRINSIAVDNLGVAEFADDFSDAFANGSTSIVTVSEPFTETAYLPPNFSEFTFSTPLEITASRLEIVGVYWLYLSRFGADEMIVNWLNDAVGETSVPILTLPYNAVEA